MIWPVRLFRGLVINCVGSLSRLVRDGSLDRSIGSLYSVIIMRPVSLCHDLVPHY